MMRIARRGRPEIAIAYVRVSTEDQRLGPEAQRAAIEQWAKREKVTVAAWHTDQGVGGGIDLEDRPGLLNALGDLREHRAGLLLVARRDRLARDVHVAIVIERAIGREGARVVSADGAGNGVGPADEFMKTVINAAAAYERALIRARTRAALQAKRARGFRAGEVPFGFVADDEGRLAPCEGELRVLDHVRLLRDEGHSLRAIVRACLSFGYTSRSGRPLALTQVARLAARTLPHAQEPVER